MAIQLGVEVRTFCPQAVGMILMFCRMPSDVSEFFGLLMSHAARPATEETPLRRRTPSRVCQTQNSQGSPIQYGRWA